VKLIDWPTPSRKFSELKSQGQNFPIPKDLGALKSLCENQKSDRSKKDIFFGLLVASQWFGGSAFYYYYFGSLFFKLG
jgi:hypothetical protein